MFDLKCPFCGGEGHGKFRQHRFYGQNYAGDKKISYRVYVKCGRCHAEGPPVITKPLINPNPSIIRGNPDPLLFPMKEWIEENRRQWDMFNEYIEKAYNLWNRRASNE